jgi:hypothetical protein
MLYFVQPVVFTLYNKQRQVEGRVLNSSHSLLCLRLT